MIGWPSDQDGYDFPAALLASGQSSDGWMEFQIPATAGTYTVLCASSGVSGTGIPFVQVNVSPSGALRFHLLHHGDASSELSAFAQSASAGRIRSHTSLMAP